MTKKHISIPKLASRFAALLLIAFIMLPTMPVHASVSNWQQKAINYYPSSADDLGGTNFQTTLQHYKSLGFNTVTLIIQLYQSNDYSTDIGPGGNTPSDASLVSAIQYAHSIGMKVMLNIHLDTYSGDWRANINPSDRANWFANYLSELEHYAQIAQSNGVEYYCLGTEMVDMASANVNSDNTQEWQNMISKIRGMYNGKLTYDANWGGPPYDEVNQVQFWSNLDFIGISAYFPLSGDGSVSQNENSWAGWVNSEIGPLESKWNMPIVFTEIGYRSVTNAYQAPFNSWNSGSYDPQGQINDYQALLDFWNKYSYMQGIDVWYAVTNPSQGGAGDTDYLIMNKPVEQTFQNWFGGNGTSTQSGPPAAFTTSGSANPSTPAVNQSVTFTAGVNDTGGAGYGDIVDLEIYDSNGTQQFQKTYDSENFTAGQGKSYAINWTPTTNGTYTFKIGVFDSNWHLYTWNDNAAQVTVGGTNNSGGSTGTSGGSTSTSTPSGGNTGGGTSTSTPSGGNSGGTSTTTQSSGGSTIPSNPTLDIWWPTDGSTISGLQPFKAMIENLALSAYNMFWQVDGGQWNSMYDNQTDYPHKEAQVDLSSWTWDGSSPYKINFIAQDMNGNTITQKAVNVYVSH